MDAIEERLSEGTWVQIVNCRLSRFSSYIVRYDPEDYTYKLMLTKDPKGRPIVKSQWINADYVMKDGFRDEDELLALIDHALDMNDKEWFLELTAQLPEELPF
ncbi:IDEAL domain-containing protein [Cytobacillus oceanisediminis]|uniref:IDEAL domain-containing protein n=1 Tax=Cytobacillus oceanisediminis TaxID=665099 RepID=UPI00207AB482|nr:IDEAL domain-containing protein [Cytobacillus oceanisediminis]USK46323.1 IDEAL domain-containing protein [Cytobacillus oceanisediminis]